MKPIITYRVIAPQQRDLRSYVPDTTMFQKYRLAENKGGFPESGIVYGSNTNLGTRWYINSVDYTTNMVVFPLNSKDALSERRMPEFKILALFRMDERQPRSI